MPIEAETSPNLQKFTKVVACHTQVLHFAFYYLMYQKYADSSIDRAPH